MKNNKQRKDNNIDNTFIGYEVFSRQDVYLNFKETNSAYIAGLSGTGKSYLINLIIKDYLNKKLKVIILSEKAHVDYKNETKKIDFTDDKELEETIKYLNDEFNSRKKEVESTNLTKTSKNPILIILDEAWSVKKNKPFNELINKIIRMGRFTRINIIIASQSISTSESEFNHRMVGIIIMSRSETMQISESVFGTGIAYTTPLKRGQFIYWNRKTQPKIIKITDNKRNLWQKIKSIFT